MLAFPRDRRRRSGPRALPNGARDREDLFLHRRAWRDRADAVQGLQADLRALGGGRVRLARLHGADLFAVNKVLNEIDFGPLMDLHDLMIALKIGRHYKGSSS